MNFLNFKRILRIFFITIIGFNLMVLATPIIIPVCFVFWVLSFTWYMVLKMKYGKTVCKPDGMDIVNGKENDVSKPYINIFGRFMDANKYPDVDKIRNRFQQLVIDERKENGQLKFRKFSQVFAQIGGYYVWKDAENFDIKNHIRIIDPDEVVDRHRSEILAKYPNCLNAETCPEHIPSHVSEIPWETILKHFLNIYGNQTVGEGAPKWEILVLPEIDHKFTTLFRVHHSITDGIYFARLIAECVADYPVAMRLPYNFRKPHFLIRAALNLWSFSLLPYGLFKMLQTSDRNPLHGMKLSGEKRFFMSEPIDIKLLKEIKNGGAKVTINDIIFSCVSHATALHFAKRKCAVDNITVLLAINLQDQNRPLRLKNDFAITVLKIPTSSSDNHSKNALKPPHVMIMKDLINMDLTKLPGLTRLQIVKNSLDKAKNDPSLMSVCWLITSFSSLLPAFISEAILSTEGITMDISNMLGPQTEDLVINGCPAIDIAYCLPDRDPLGIAVSIVSYNGFLRVGLTVDKTLMPLDQEGTDFLNSFKEEVTNLHNEVTYVGSIREKDYIEINELQSIMYKDIP